MALDVLLTEGAERDFEEIYRYIAEHDAPEKAERVIAAIDQACASLAELPERGSVPKELRLLGLTGYREVHYKPYRIIYRVVGRQMIVHCVLDGRRDMQTLLHLRLTR
jgi:toxin ParE1/3/4